MKFEVHGPRVYRHVGLPVAAFDILCELKRLTRLETNAEVLCWLLLTAGKSELKKLQSLARSSQGIDQK